MLTSIPALAGLFVLLVNVVSAVPLDLNERTYTSPSNYENDTSPVLLRREALPCAADLYCELLNKTGAATLPGWKKFVKAAEADTGSKGLTIRFSDEHEKGEAYVSVSRAAIPMTKKGTPTCTSSTQTLSGSTAGTSGTVAVAVAAGYTVAAQYQIMLASTFGYTGTMTASLSFSDLLDGGGIFSDNVAVTATEMKSVTKTTNELTTSTVTMDTSSGKKCTISQVVKTCVYETTGNVDFVAAGNVWFEYGSTVANKARKAAGKHYKWSYPLTSLSLAERSTKIEFTGSLSVTSKGTYSEKCT